MKKINKHFYFTSVKRKFKLFCPDPFFFSTKNTGKMICFYLHHCLDVSFHTRDSCKGLEYALETV